MRSRKVMPLLGLGTASAMAAALLTAAPANAANAQVVVPCSAADLAAAIDTANVGGGGTLQLTPSCTYSITTPDTGEIGLPEITSEITILGSGATIRRDSAATEVFRIFEVAPAGDLTLSALKVEDGNPVGDGGGIRNDGALTLNAVKVKDNSTEGVGGGIFNTGVLRVNASKIAYNSAVEGGGGIANQLLLEAPPEVQQVAGSTVKLRAASVSHNTVTGVEALGGGILNQEGTVKADVTTVHGNEGTDASSQGGGIATVGGVLKLRVSTVRTNVAGSAPGGIYNDGSTVTKVASPVFANVPTNCAGSPDPVPGCFG